MKNIGFYVKRGSPEAGAAARQAVKWLDKNGCEAIFEQETSEEYDLPGGASSEEFTKRCEIIVVLGGDGTFLAAARVAAAKAIPIAGVNLGGLGYLTETTIEEMPEILDLICSDRAEYEERDLFDVLVECERRKECFRVLNDVVITKSAMARVINLQVSIGDEIITNMLADGIIVSTPTGSTAYSMSAGGPICHPSVKAIILTPICPHMLANRPLIMPGSVRLRIELVRGGESFVTMDGQVGMEFNVGDYVEVGRSESTLKFFRNPNRTYYQTLRDKLRWGKR